jgi:signal transduction histidine kinase
MSMLVARRPTYPPQTRLLVTERLLIAGLRAQERAEESEAARIRFEFLFRASRTLAQSLEPASVLQAVLDLVVPELGDAATFFVPARGAAQASSAISDGLAARPPEWWNWVERVTRAVVNTSLADAASDSGTASPQKSKSRGLAVDAEPVNYVVVSLQAHGRVLGALRILRVSPRPKYRQQDQELIEAFADQAGLALANARLFQEQRAVVAHLEVMRGRPDAAQREWLRDDERRRIARDLHDYVEQNFYALGLTASGALDASRHPLDISELADALRHVLDISSAGAEQLRNAIFGLKHRDAPFGLIGTLRNMVRSFEQRTGMQTDLILYGPESEIPASLSETLLAVAHESLANVERHARASSVIVRLQLRSRTITLTVHDDGMGGSAPVAGRDGSSATHFGLSGLRERVRALHGHFSAKPGANGGFVVRARLPRAKDAA